MAPTRSEMVTMVTLLVIAGLRSGGAQVARLTPADTVHTDFGGLPQLVFSPQPPLAALDPRRQLSLQQQTHILTDIQQHHHRFFQQGPQQQQQQPLPLSPSAQQQLGPQPAQPLLYSQQTDVGGAGPGPSAPRETEPIFQAQPGQFVRLHAQAAAPPSAGVAAPPPPSAPAAQHYHHHFSAQQPLVRAQGATAFGGPQQQHLQQAAHVPPSAAAAVLQNSLQGSVPNSTSGDLSPHEQVRSLRRRPGDGGAAVVSPNGAPAPLARPRGRSEDGGAHQQLFLQDERQKLFEQIKDYNQQQQQKPQAPPFPLEQPAPGGDDSPLPPPSDLSDNPLKAQDARAKTSNPLRQQQQQQQLQAQLQKQFQLQLLQRQELIRQLKQALANTPAPAHRDQILPHPSAPAARLGNSSAPLFLANGQQLQIFDSPQERASSVAHNAVSTRSTVAAPTPPPPPATAPPAPAAPAAPAAPTPTAPTAPVKAPKALFDELTKGVLPPGAEFEVIRHKQDGGLEEVNKLPSNLPDKKVTFVFLEEQPDGSVKIQGVRGNAEPAVNKTSPEGIDSILKKLQEGNIKLPPSTKLQGVPTGLPAVETTPQASVLNPTFLTKTSSERAVPSPRPNVLLPTLNPKTDDLLPRLSDNTVSLPAPSDMEFFPSVAFSSPDQLSSTPNPYFEINNFQQQLTTTAPPPPPPPPSPSAAKPSPNSESLFISSPSSQPAYNSRNVIPGNSAGVPQFGKQDTVRIAAPANRPTSPPRAPALAPAPAVTAAPARAHFSPTPVTTVAPPVVIVNSPSPSSLPPTTLRPSPRPTARASSPSSPPPPPPPPPPPAPVVSRVSFPGSEAASSNGSAALTSAPAGVLTQVLKKEGLFAMAKFLKDSGLDSILNDTGPYTIFIPTDKAFRALLVQLGGPDKAEIKFRENPRLLSGLLLHHVIPGSFQLADLQDEMTGVSLAGTQLRVNTYRTQDTHWNDVQVTTINGARVVRGLHDIPVPQGVAHALDRVMFPLPVGDLLQTLAADRERRFTRLLRLARVAGMENLLSGARTHTLLAPTDKALTAAPGGELQRALKDAGRARALLQRHLVAGALYGAGLRFYQERPTLAANRPVALAKADGQLKANSAHVLTPNIPATNGVLHVIDSVL